MPGLAYYAGIYASIMWTGLLARRLQLARLDCTRSTECIRIRPAEIMYNLGIRELCGNNHCTCVLRAQSRLGLGAWRLCAKASPPHGADRGS